MPTTSTSRRPWSCPSLLQRIGTGDRKSGGFLLHVDARVERNGRIPEPVDPDRTSAVDPARRRLFAGPGVPQAHELCLFAP